MNDKEYDVVIVTKEEIPNPESNQKYRSLNEAINHDYDFTISEVCAKAWARVSGNKLPIFIAVLLAVVLSFVVSFIGSLIVSVLGFIPFLEWAVEVLISGISAMFAVGVILVVLKLFNNESVNATNDFFNFSKFWLPILILSIVMTILVTIGFILLVIPGIYLLVSYSLAYWILTIHPNESFWDILEASRKIVSRHWFKFFILNLVIGLILMISAIPFGIGLIWTLPLCNFMYAIIFTSIFEK